MSLSNYITRKIINYDSDKSLAFQFRIKRAERIKHLITSCFKKYGFVNIIDIGGTRYYWKIIPLKFLKENNVRVTIVNLSPNILSHHNDEIFKFVFGDGCNLSQFADNSFHIAHSNSVIEHLGSWENKIKMANEIKRVAQQYYVQTPNFYFPIEPHFVTPFIHWLPKRLRVHILANFNLGWWIYKGNYERAKKEVENTTLLTKSELLDLFPESKLYNERFVMIAKSFVVIKHQD